MTVSMRRMSAGSGYQYLLRSVAAGDGNRTMSIPLTRYYTEVGTPPGRWMGSGLSALGGGRLMRGSPVAEEQLALLIGMGRDPVTGDQLGRAYPVYKTLADRIQDRVDALDPEMTFEDCTAETTRIEAEEAGAGARHAVAGFDLTFSVPKSVSVLWGVADAAIQERIAQAHHAALADVLDYLEREVAATRTGVADGEGAVAQVEVAGVAAVAYDHYDSRAGDPQLHTHLVVSNKVMTALDGRWRSLDGRALYPAITGLSAHYNALLADRLTRELGITWQQCDRGPDRNPQWEITGVGEKLIKEFSSRSREIDLEKDRLIADYIALHGRRPSEKTIVELRAQATLATRPAKEVRSLADLTESWRQRTAPLVGGEPSTWARGILGRRVEPLRVDDVSLRMVESIASDVLQHVSLKRSTWSHWNLVAETSRQTMHFRFATAEDREAVVSLIVDAVKEHSIQLTPPELALSPAAFRRPDGTSVFRPRHSAKYTSTAIFEAEARLLGRSEDTGGPTVDAGVVRRVARRGRPRLSPQQTAALETITTSGRRLDVLVGPAGAGKTTAMRALRSAWIIEHGQGSVIGLAPSASAAQTLAGDLGIKCDNTAKWLHEHQRGNANFVADQLVIIDEASLAGTATLDRITAIASAAGAKVLLVGDARQLQSVEAGGAFRLLVERRVDPPTLTEIRRFNNDWEKKASLQLQRGDPQVIATYATHQRIQQGSTSEMLDAAYEAWRSDTSAGKASILITESLAAVRSLNERARAERLALDGAIDGREIKLDDGLRASIGDVIITRRNQRTLRTTRGGWVKNGDLWTITDIRPDGSVVARARGPRHRGSTVLPSDYVREHADLGYAVTTHRAQGVTTDTAHNVVTPATSRESLYVEMTRGRESNIAYVPLDQPDDLHDTPKAGDVTGRSVLYGVLQRSSAKLSAHQTVEEEFTRHASVAKLAAELETIAAEAQRERFAELLARSGLTPEQHEVMVSSTAFGPLSASLRRAEAYGYDLEKLMPRIVGRHTLATADDAAAVLRSRVDKAVASRGRRTSANPHLIAGLVPEPLGPMSEEDGRAISERRTLIENRARTLAEHALKSREPWVQRLAPPPGAGEDPAWVEALIGVAAYRDRYGITSALPLGASPDSEAQRADRERARASLDSARCLAEQSQASRPRAMDRNRSTGLSV